MKARKEKRRKKGFDTRKVRLHVITRHVLADGETIEYHDTLKGTMPYCDLPEKALPVTGTKDDYCLVEMEPELPEYCMNLERDKQGNPLKAYNFFDAQGYYTYAIDNRIKEAEQAATAVMQERREHDWKKIVTVLACVVVVVAVIWRFYA